jgi:hypothetical protein
MRIAPLLVAGAAALALAFVAILPGCGGTSEKNTPEVSLTQSHEATPNPAVAQWGGARVTTVCLAESQVYPQEPDLRLPVSEWLRTLLTPVGIAIAESAGPCDATLEVSARIVATPGLYQGRNGPVTLYTAGDWQFAISLTAAGRQPIVFEDHPLSVGSPSSLASSSTPDTPREYIVGHSDFVIEYLLRAATKIWGMAPAIESFCLPLEEPYDRIDLVNFDLLDASGLYDAYVAGSPVPNDYASWRLWFETGEVAGQTPLFRNRSAGCE